MNKWATYYDPEAIEYSSADGDGTFSTTVTESSFEEFTRTIAAPVGVFKCGYGQSDVTHLPYREPEDNVIDKTFSFDMSTSFEKGRTQYLESGSTITHQTKAGGGKEIIRETTEEAATTQTIGRTMPRWNDHPTKEGGNLMLWSDRQFGPKTTQFYKTKEDIQRRRVATQEYIDTHRIGRTKFDSYEYETTTDATTTTPKSVDEEAGRTTESKTCTYETTTNAVEPAVDQEENIPFRSIKRKFEMKNVPVTNWVHANSGKMQARVPTPANIQLTQSIHHGEYDAPDPFGKACLNTYVAGKNGSFEWIESDGFTKSYKAGTTITEKYAHLSEGKVVTASSSSTYEAELDGSETHKFTINGATASTKMPLWEAPDVYGLGGYEISTLGKRTAVALSSTSTLWEGEGNETTYATGFSSSATRGATAMGTGDDRGKVISVSRHATITTTYEAPKPLEPIPETSHTCTKEPTEDNDETTKVCVVCLSREVHYTARENGEDVTLTSTEGYGTCEGTTTTKTTLYEGEDGWEYTIFNAPLTDTIEVTDLATKLADTIIQANTNPTHSIVGAANIVLMKFGSGDEQTYTTYTDSAEALDTSSFIETTFTQTQNVITKSEISQMERDQSQYYTTSSWTHASEATFDGDDNSAIIENEDRYNLNLLREGNEDSGGSRTVTYSGMVPTWWGNAVQKTYKKSDEEVNEGLGAAFDEKDQKLSYSCYPFKTLSREHFRLKPDQLTMVMPTIVSDELTIWRPADFAHNSYLSMAVANHETTVGGADSFTLNLDPNDVTTTAEVIRETYNEDEGFVKEIVTGATVFGMSMLSTTETSILFQGIKIRTTTSQLSFEYSATSDNLGVEGFGKGKDEVEQVPSWKPDNEVTKISTTSQDFTTASTTDISDTYFWNDLAKTRTPQPKLVETTTDAIELSYDKTQFDDNAISLGYGADEVFVVNITDPTRTTNFGATFEMESPKVITYGAVVEKYMGDVANNFISCENSDETKVRAGDLATFDVEFDGEDGEFYGYKKIPVPEVVTRKYTAHLSSAQGESSHSTSQSYSWGSTQKFDDGDRITDSFSSSSEGESATTVEAVIQDPEGHIGIKQVNPIFAVDNNLRAHPQVYKLGTPVTPTREYFLPIAYAQMRSYYAHDYQLPATPSSLHETGNFIGTGIPDGVEGAGQANKEHVDAGKTLPRDFAAHNTAFVLDDYATAQTVSVDYRSWAEFFQVVDNEDNAIDGTPDEMVHPLVHHSAFPDSNILAPLHKVPYNGHLVRLSFSEMIYFDTIQQTQTTKSAVVDPAWFDSWMRMSDTDGNYPSENSSGVASMANPTTLIFGFHSETDSTAQDYRYPVITQLEKNGGVNGAKSYKVRRDGENATAWIPKYSKATPTDKIERETESYKVEFSRQPDLTGDNGDNNRSSLQHIAFDLHNEWSQVKQGMDMDGKREHTITGAFGFRPHAQFRHYSPDYVFNEAVLNQFHTLAEAYTYNSAVYGHDLTVSDADGTEHFAGGSGDPLIGLHYTSSSSLEWPDHNQFTTGTESIDIGTHSDSSTFTLDNSDESYRLGSPTIQTYEPLTFMRVRGAYLTIPTDYINFEHCIVETTITA